MHLFQADDGPRLKYRSSGVLVCTGSGSTAWMKNAHGISNDIVSKILARVNANISPQQAKLITKEMNESCIYPPDDLRVQYLIREPIDYGESDAGHNQKKHGWSNKVVLKSLGWDASLTLDGLWGKCTCLFCMKT